ncbi:MAG: hypothetical protein GKR98_07775 [Boseongicola sp.]|nr:MAG: hypothetical protein GKR98_07775 [Boseongicola sp.]
MGNWRISKQIGALNGIALGILTVASLAGVIATLLLTQIISHFSASADRTLAVQEIGSHVYEGRLAALKYRVLDDAAFVEAVNDSFLNAYESERQIVTNMDASSDLFAIHNELFAKIGTYRETFANLADIRAERSQSIKEMTAAGDTAKIKLDVLMDQLFNEGHKDAAFHSALAQRNMKTGKIAIERFIRSGDPADFQRTEESLTDALTELDLINDPSVPDRYLAPVAETRALLNSFISASHEVHRANDIDVGLSSELDQLGPDLKSGLQSVTERVVSSQNALEISGRDRGRIIIAFLICAALLSGIGLAVAARRTAAGISAGINTSVTEMASLADGDLAIEITNTERENELGEIARALEVFRSNSIETQKMQEKIRENEADEAKAREEQTKRDQVTEEAQRAAMEKERSAIIQDLSQGLGTVLDAAARGDFSKRIDKEFGNEELDKIAAAVNELVANVSVSIGETARVLARLAEGDLCERMNGQFEGIFNDLENGLTDTTITLGNLVTEIRTQCEEIGASSSHMRDQAGELAKRAEHQSSALEETSGAMAEMSASVQTSAEAARQSAGIAQAATQRVDEAGAVVSSAISAMTDIQTASDKINEIVTVMDGIAFQTNLLALNASVEAARAGSAGKGFAVVATEVRALAQRSGEASKDIKSLIDESATQVVRGVELVEKTGDTLTDVVTRVRDMAETMDSLTASAQEQATSVSRVSDTVSQMDGITQKNAKLAEDSRMEARQLAEKMEVMRAQVNRFKTENEGGNQQTQSVAA